VDWRGGRGVIGLVVGAGGVWKGQLLGLLGARACTGSLLGRGWTGRGAGGSLGWWWGIGVWGGLV